MKKTILVVLLFTAIAMAFKSEKDGSVIGKTFPSMECESYDGKKINLPTATLGKYTLLGMAFDNDAEAALDSWISPVYNTFIVKSDNKQADVFNVSTEYDVNLFFIPMFTGFNQLTIKKSKEKIQSKTDKELYPYLLFYKGGKTYKAELDFEKKSIPYFFVLDKTGKIVYATSGRYDAKKFDKILDIIGEN